MLHQFNAQRFRWWNGRRIGTVPVGTIVYIQDGVRPLNGICRPVTRRNPWLVEAWLNRDYTRSSSGNSRLSRSLGDTWPKSVVCATGGARW
jgi:hypothetical protein